jgi:NAD(P)H-hydrate epimerase
MARLTKRETADLADAPLEAAREAARLWGQVVVLKFGYTVATDGTRAVVSPEAPGSLATAGSGDVFAGTIGAFLAQGLEPMDAAALAIYVGCRAARRVERSVGTLGLVASDLPAAIAEALAELEREGAER